MDRVETLTECTLRFISQFSEEITKYDISKLEYVKRQADELNKLVKENKILQDPFISSLLLDGLKYRRKGALL